MIKKSFLIFSLLFLSIFSSGYDVIGLTNINPEKNAYIHNNLGLGYLSAGQFDAAVQEFKIAISLNPNTQATSTFYNNLGETYYRLGYFANAQDCFEKAINRYPLNFKFYLNLVSTYQNRNTLDYNLKRLTKYKKTPLDDITIGLIYIAKGQKQKGIIVLDNFTINEPKLFITDGVKYYLKELTNLK